MTSSDQLLINVAPSQVRAALVENNTPVEIHIERGDSRSMVGNIYAGRVVRVLPGMQAAFVDIGLERTGFLYVNDAITTPPITAPTVPSAATPSPLDDASRSAAATFSNDSTHDESTATPLPEQLSDVSEPTAQRPQHRQPPLADIKDILHEGQTILVQIQKDPLGTKGARLTRQITLPGRHVVLMPFSTHIGISHRITAPAERERLKQIILAATHHPCGAILRTAAENIAAETLTHEIDSLAQRWHTIQQTFAKSSHPQLIFADLDLTLRIIRDFFGANITRILVDSPDAYARIQQFIRDIAPAHVNRVELHTDAQPIFNQYHIETELNRMRDRRVWLKSGGYIVIDQTEALTVIDVNTGRFVGKSTLEDTMTQLNLEAAREIAYQLRLRNIGGIIVIDFIDMADPSNRDRVIAALQDALVRDKAKSTIIGMSEIGLLQMTRKRVRDSVYGTLTQPCPYCQGRGCIKNVDTITQDLLRELRVLAARPQTGDGLQAFVHPDIASQLRAKHSDELAHMKSTLGKELLITSDNARHHENYQINII